MLLGKQDTLNNKDTVCCPNHIELCTNLSLSTDTSLYRTVSWVRVVSSIERFSHCNVYKHIENNSCTGAAIVYILYTYIHYTYICINYKADVSTSPHKLGTLF